MRSRRKWLRGKDSNQRPPGYEPDELPTALPRDEMMLIDNTTRRRLCQAFFILCRTETILTRLRTILFGAFPRPKLTGKILPPALRRRKAKFATPCIYARCPHQSLRLLSPTNRARFNLVKKLSARLPRCAALRGPRSKIIRKSLVLRCKQLDGVEPGSYCSGPACSPRQNEYVSVRFPSVLFRGLTFGQDTTACVPTYLTVKISEFIIVLPIIFLDRISSI